MLLALFLKGHLWETASSHSSPQSTRSGVPFMVDLVEISAHLYRLKQQGLCVYGGGWVQLAGGAFWSPRVTEWKKEGGK